jgi:hypothetical protein
MLFSSIPSSFEQGLAFSFISFIAPLSFSFSPLLSFFCAILP